MGTLDIFNNPGNGNLYFIHSSLLILTKVSKNIELNEKDHNIIENIGDLISKNKLSESLALYVLYSQIQAFLSIKS
jgi:hypothetical protein